MTDTALAAFTALLNNAEDAEERKALYDIVAEELEIRELLEWSLGSEGRMFHRARDPGVAGVVAGERGGDVP